MSAGALAADARAELAAVVPTRRCDRLAETSGLFHTAGTVHLLGRGALSFHLDLAELPVARRAFAILRELRVDAEIRTYNRRSFDRAARTQLLVAGSPHAIDILSQAGVLGRDGLPLDRPPGHVVARPCCRSAYLRGAFLGGGSLSRPKWPHLEVRTPLHAGAAFVRSVASAAGVRMRVLDRESHSAAYAKSWDSIEAYLSDRRRVGDRSRPRGTCARRRLAGGCEPRRERRPREPRPPKPLGAGTAERGTGAPGLRRAGRPRSDAPGRGRASPAPPVSLVARARHAGRPARHEGGDGRPTRTARRAGGGRFRASAGYRCGLSRSTVGPILPSGGPALPGGGFRPRPPPGAGARMWGRGFPRRLLPQPTVSPKQESAEPDPGALITAAAARTPEGVRCRGRKRHRLAGRSVVPRTRRAAEEPG